MADKPSIEYNEKIEEEFNALINSLDLKEQRSKDYLRMRWLDQVKWMEKRAGEMRDRHRRYRLNVIIFSALVPIIVASNFSQDKEIDKILKVATISISAIVTVSSAIDEFYQFGNRWYSYRKAAKLTVGSSFNSAVHIAAIKLTKKRYPFLLIRSRALFSAMSRFTCLKECST
ncbi:MAG: hypothetical protein C4287_14220 [Leptolyngbya sp. ERB_1_2]